MGKSAKRPVKRRVEGGGRVTPKKTVGQVTSASGDHSAASASSRYTPPVSTYQMPSSRWVPIAMFGFLGFGFVMIFCNYVGLVPGGTNNWYLVAGLGFILAGIITATQYR
jgi:hypothetical protein